MISNPIKLFVSGNNEEEFTYEGGKHLYHFSPKQCGLSNTMEMNLIFFANNGKHALDVLERMFKFCIKCRKTYNNLYGTPIERFQHLLDNKEKWIVTLAPIDQMFIVGWASNKTI